MLGEVYLEVLECRGLPNTDDWGSFGNKMHAFILMVYGDVMVHMEVRQFLSLDDCLPC